MSAEASSVNKRVTGAVSVGEAAAMWRSFHAAFSPLRNPGEVMGHGNKILIKDETVSETRAFKERGVHIAVAALGERALNGLVTGSAGNHALAVALAANRLGTNADIFVPESVARCKVECIRKLGGTAVRLHVRGQDVAESLGAAAAFTRRHLELNFIHPYDDENIIRGQGVIGSELVEQLGLRQIRDAAESEQAAAQLLSKFRIITAVGGGSLIAGIAEAVHKEFPEVRINGVELTGADSAHRSLRMSRPLGRPAIVPISGTLNSLADGTATRSVGTLPFGIILSEVEDIFIVTDAELGAAYSQAISQADERTAVLGDEAYTDLPETAAMLPRALALKMASNPRYSGETWILLESGRNTDVTRVNQALQAFENSRPAAKQGTSERRIAVASAPFPRR